MSAPPHTEPPSRNCDSNREFRKDDHAFPGRQYTRIVLRADRETKRQRKQAPSDKSAAEDSDFLLPLKSTTIA
jgi:hypothetical protein